MLPAEVSEAALIQPTRFEPEVLLPPLPGDPVRLAVNGEREMALSFDDVERKLPAGLSRSNEPAYLDLDFIDGTKGAHVNISGISGVATKTSYATFLLYSMFTSGVLGAEAANTKALIFNVKGEDLLFLDHGNTALDADRAERYDAMGLAPSPFRDVGILAPPRKGDPNATPATGARHLGVSPFLWTIADFCRMQLLPFLFADAEDERQQYTIVVPGGDGSAGEAGRHRSAVAPAAVVRVTGRAMARFGSTGARSARSASWSMRSKTSCSRRTPTSTSTSGGPAGPSARARSAPSFAGWRRPGATWSTSFGPTSPMRPATG